MIKIKNKTTGEVKKVFQAEVDANGYVKNNDGKTFGKRFITSWAGILTETTDEDGQQVFTLSEGWEVITRKGERKPRQPKAKATEAAKDEPKPEEVVPATVVTEKSEPAAPTTQADDEAALIAAIKNLRGGQVDDAKVRRIFAEELAKLSEPQQKAVAKVAKKAAKKAGEAYCEKFQRIVAKVSRGNNVYLFGPAGSGKSHTAEQVAEALGLDFYGQTTIQFAHDVRGYGDAGGNFQETPFYKAFAFGGLYFQDEYDRSNAEAAIVLNSALANGWYDFPIVGRVEAHPNFRFMAAGNTLMTGADEEYVTGQEIDASSRDRFAYFFEIDYSHEVELHIAHGNENIVSFVEDVRQAIKQTGLKHVVSYRATAAMTDEVENENDLTACCDESIFKALDTDARREIYARLNDRANVWAKALKKLL